MKRMKKTLKKRRENFFVQCEKKETNKKKKIRTTVDDVFRDKIQNTSHSNDMIDLFYCLLILVEKVTFELFTF